MLALEYHLALNAPAVYQGRQMDKSITSGFHDAYVTLDISLVISRPFLPVARVVQQGHTAHLGETPGLRLRTVLECQSRPS